MFRHRPFQKIIVPTDCSPRSERAIPYAVDFARVSNGEVILLHVFTPPMHEFVDSLAIAGEYEMANRIRDEIKQHLLGLRNEVRAQKVACRVQLIDGVGIAQHIISYVDDEKADLVVMTTHDVEEASMRSALEKIAALDTVASPPRLIRIEAL